MLKVFLLHGLDDLRGKSTAPLPYVVHYDADESRVRVFGYHGNNTGLVLVAEDKNESPICHVPKQLLLESVTYS